MDTPTKTPPLTRAKPPAHHHNAWSKSEELLSEIAERLERIEGAVVQPPLVLYMGEAPRACSECGQPVSPHGGFVHGLGASVAHSACAAVAADNGHPVDLPWREPESLSDVLVASILEGKAEPTNMDRPIVKRLFGLSEAVRAGNWAQDDLKQLAETFRLPAVSAPWSREDWQRARHTAEHAHRAIDLVVQIAKVAGLDLGHLDDEASKALLLAKVCDAALTAEHAKIAKIVGEWERSLKIDVSGHPADATLHQRLEYVQGVVESLKDDSEAFAECAHAIGCEHVPDTGPTFPGPHDEVVRQIKDASRAKMDQHELKEEIKNLRYHLAFLIQCATGGEVREEDEAIDDQEVMAAEHAIAALRKEATAARVDLVRMYEAAGFTGSTFGEDEVSGLIAQVRTWRRLNVDMGNELAQLCEAAGFGGVDEKRTRSFQVRDLVAQIKAWRREDRKR